MLGADDVTYGVVGTALGVAGAGLSVTELQAIVSIIVTILSFIIGVLVPVIIKIVNKIKEVKADGVITPEEKEELKNEIKEGINTVTDGAKELAEKVKGDKE